MIHRVNVSALTGVQELKKEVRKKLMTGGAVIRLEEGLSSSDLETIFEAYSPGIERNGVQMDVLREIQQHEAVTENLKIKIAAALESCGA